jgi:hypothetical protein
MPLAAAAALLGVPGPPIAAASLARFAASLSPLVPFAPAELLITPLLAELMESLLVSSTFLQPDAQIANAAIDTASTAPFGFQCMVAPVRFVARGARHVFVDT